MVTDSSGLDSFPSEGYHDKAGLGQTYVSDGRRVVASEIWSEPTVTLLISYRSPCITLGRYKPDTRLKAELKNFDFPAIVPSLIPNTGASFDRKAYTGPLNLCINSSVAP
jgi:hypothetical protein